MQLDIIVGGVIVVGSFFGWRNGAMATVWQTLNAAAAAFGAKFLAIPAAKFLLKAVDWTCANLYLGLNYSQDFKQPKIF